MLHVKLTTLEDAFFIVDALSSADYNLTSDVNKGEIVSHKEGKVILCFHIYFTHFL